MIRIAIVGAGGYARHHIHEFLKHPEFTISALVDPSPNSLEATTNHFPALAQTPLFRTFEEFLAAKPADAVLISSPHTLHCAQVVASLQAGLHVLCDKPLATSVPDVKSMIAARDASGKVGAIAYQRHAQAEWVWIREIIANNRYGKLRFVNNHLGQEWLQGTVGSWRQNPTLSGGGQLNDSGSHMIDVLLWATGLKASRVTAMMDYCGTEVDINSAVSIQFESGQLATLSVIGDGARWHERHYLWFEEAMIELAEGAAKVHQRNGLVSTVSSWPSHQGIQANFADAILRGQPVLAPFECGLRTIELTQAAWVSHENQGKPVKVADLG